MRTALLALGIAGSLSACAATPEALQVYQPPAGSNLVLEGPIAAAPGHHLVTGDLVTPPGFDIALHTHEGEEFLYVIGGSATLFREGKPDLELRPGQGVRIAPGEVHGGRSGPQGLRAVSTWIVPDGAPLRTPVTQ